MYLLLAALGLIVLYLFAKRGDIIVSLGRMRYAAEQFDEAERFLLLADRIGGCSFNSQLMKAYLMLKLGRLDEASKQVTLLSMQTRDKTQKLQIRMTQALVYWKQGDLPTAIEMLEEVVEKFPNTSAYGSLGLLYILEGDIGKAVEFNLLAYDYNKDDATIVDNLAFSYYKSGELDLADRYYQEALALSPRFPEVYYYYGKLLLERNNAEQALEYFNRALEKRFSFTSTITRDMVQQEIDAISPSSP